MGMGFKLRVLSMAAVAFFLSYNAGAVKLTVMNNCSFPVWPAIQPNGGHRVLLDGGFTLTSKQSRTLDMANNYWSGRVWGRTGCTVNPATGRSTCSTGDCAGVVACNGVGGSPPMTLAQLSLNDRDGQSSSSSSYSISVVDGFNLPMAVTPVGGGGRCVAAGCVSEAMVAGGGCPRELRMMNGNEVVACNSACRAFNLDVFCCRNAYGSSQTCQPTLYSLWFKKECPNAYTYAHDTPKGDFTCSSPEELRLTFCP